MSIQELVNAVQEGAALQKDARESGNTPPNAGINPSDLIPVSMVPEDEDFRHLFTDKQWKWLLRKREHNGLSHAIVVMGERRLFLSRSRFTEWLATRAESA